MKAMQINIHLSADRALELGLTQWGDSTVTPSEADLIVLTEAEREALAGYVKDTMFAGRLLVQSPDWEGVVSALRKKMEENARVKAQREQAMSKEREALHAFLLAGRFYDPETLKRIERPYAVYSEDSTIQPLLKLIQTAAENQRRELVLQADAALTREDKEGREKVLGAARDWVGGPYDPEPARALEFERLDSEETRMAREAEKEMDHHAVRTLLEVAAPTLVERFDAGVLPEEELTPIVEDHLFKMFDYPTKFARYELLTEGDIEHIEADCYEPIPKFNSAPYEGTFDQDEWESLKEVKEKAPEDTTVEVRQHKAWCGACNADTTERYSIRVSRSFAGKVYHRSLALN